LFDTKTVSETGRRVDDDASCLVDLDVEALAGHHRVKHGLDLPEPEVHPRGDVRDRQRHAFRREEYDFRLKAILVHG
jgi:hypothetical protein